MDAKKQTQTPDSTANIWDNEELLSELVQRASANGDQLVKVLLKASLQTLTTDQEDQNYRQRVVNALEETEDQPAKKLAEEKDDEKISSKTTDDDNTTQLPTVSPIKIPTLEAPKPVSLYDDPTTEQTPSEPNPMGISRETAILHEEARRELLRPILAFAACAILLLVLGLGWFSRSGALGLPQAAYAKPTKPIPAQTTTENPSLKPTEVEQPTKQDD